MPADPQIVRQWLLLKMLASRRQGLAVRELAEELHVGEKTIRRDLELLRSVGFALEEHVGERGRKTWRLASGATEAAMSFTFDELLALYLGRRLLDPLGGTFVWQAAQQAFKKIRTCVAPSALKYLETMAGRLHLTEVGAGDYSQKGEILDEVQRGIEESKATLIEYQSQRSTEAVTYEVFPYALANHRGSLYLVAHSRDHDQVRLFKVDRIESADVTEFPFHRPDDFDVAEYFRGSFGVFQGAGDVLVRVRFLPEVARSRIKMARQPAIDEAEGRQPARRVPPLQQRGDQALADELRPAGDRPGTRLAAGGDRRRVTAHVGCLRTSCIGADCRGVLIAWPTRRRRAEQRRAANGSKERHQEKMTRRRKRRRWNYPQRRRTAAR